MPVDHAAVSAIFVLRRGLEGEAWVKAILGSPRFSAQERAFECPIQFLGWQPSPTRTVTADSAIEALQRGLNLLRAQLAVIQHSSGEVLRAEPNGAPVDLTAFRDLLAALTAVENYQHDDAIDCVKRYAHLGVPECEAILGSCYQFGTGVALDELEAVRWYRLAAAQRHPVACQNLSVMLLTGVPGLEKDREESRRYSAQRGQAPLHDSSTKIY